MVSLLRKQVEELVGSDRMDELKDEMQEAIDSCDYKAFLGAYQEALEWCIESRGWKDVDRNEAFDYQYKTLPRFKNEFGKVCVCKKEVA